MALLNRDHATCFEKIDLAAGEAEDVSLQLDLLNTSRES